MVAQMIIYPLGHKSLTTISRMMSKYVSYASRASNIYMPRYEYYGLHITRSTGSVLTPREVIRVLIQVSLSESQCVRAVV